MHPVRDYGIERQIVSSFLTDQQGHPAVRCALDWLDGWLVSASSGADSLPASSQMVRLARHGVTPFDILAEASALFLLSRWSPRRLPDDVRLDYAIGNRILGLAPLEKRFGGLRGGKPRTYYPAIGQVTIRTVGQRIRRHLAPLFANLAAAVEAQEQAKKHQYTALATPFNAPLTTESSTKTSLDQSQ